MRRPNDLFKGKVNNFLQQADPLWSLSRRAMATELVRLMAGADKNPLGTNFNEAVHRAMHAYVVRFARRCSYDMLRRVLFVFMCTYNRTMLLKLHDKHAKHEREADGAATAAAAAAAAPGQASGAAVAAAPGRGNGSVAAAAPGQADGAAAAPDQADGAGAAPGAAAVVGKKKLRGRADNARAGTQAIAPVSNRAPPAALPAVPSFRAKFLPVELCDRTAYRSAVNSTTDADMRAIATETNIKWREANDNGWKGKEKDMIRKLREYLAGTVGLATMRPIELANLYQTFATIHSPLGVTVNDVKKWAQKLVLQNERRS